MAEPSERVVVAGKLVACGLVLTLAAEAYLGKAEPHLEVHAYHLPHATTLNVYTATSSTWISASTAGSETLLRFVSV